MNINNIITIHIPNHLHDFLIMTFGYDEKNRCIPINLRKEIGLYIYSHISLSHKPVTIDKDATRLLIPIHKDIQHKIDTSFIYFTKFSQTQIVQFIEATFRRYIYDFFSVGYSIGYNQTAIIDGLLVSLNKKKNSISYDQLKQMDYRTRKRYRQEIYRTISNEILK